MCERPYSMKRKIYEEMLRWKQENGRTALLIDGERRVGKSYIAEEFARREYRSYILVDFNRASSEIRDLFIHYLDDLDAFFMYLSGYYGVKLYERDSLIIFDEVSFFRGHGPLSNTWRQMVVMITWRPAL